MKVQPKVTTYKIDEESRTNITAAVKLCRENITSLQVFNVNMGKDGTPFEQVARKLLLLCVRDLTLHRTFQEVLYENDTITQTQIDAFEKAHLSLYKQRDKLLANNPGFEDEWTKRIAQANLFTEAVNIVWDDYHTTCDAIDALRKQDSNLNFWDNDLMAAFKVRSAKAIEHTGYSIEDVMSKIMALEYQY